MYNLQSSNDALQAVGDLHAGHRQRQACRLLEVGVLGHLLTCTGSCISETQQDLTVTSRPILVLVSVSLSEAASGYQQHATLSFDDALRSLCLRRAVSKHKTTAESTYLLRRRTHDWRGPTIHPHLPAKAPGAQCGIFPIVLHKAHVMRARVNPQRLQAAQVQLLWPPWVWLQNDLQS